MIVHAAIDSTADQLLQRDAVTRLMRLIFQRPPWVMWGGVLLALVAAVLALRWFLRRLPAIRAAIALRGGLKWAALLSVAGIVAVAATAAVRTVTFMKTDTRFCSGCHLFVPVDQVMRRPDAGNFKLVSELAGAHGALACADCHVSTMPKQAMKMLYWMSGVRDSTMPYEAPVPRARCDQCHGQEPAPAAWKAIAATAGHRAHLESDTIRLRPAAECLTCHAESAHRFAPSNETCVQQGCHLQEEVRIQLGRMAGVQPFHCVLCHQFTREVPALAALDSVRARLRRPELQECAACHAMEQALPGFDPARDPHNGSCGMCHNPHTQVKPADALRTCASAGCHADWKRAAFHAGAAHRRVATRCEMCHQPHAARVDAADCAGCHNRVPGLSPQGGRLPRRAGGVL